MWAKHFNGTGQNMPTNLLQDNQGNYFVYGNFSGAVNQDALSLTAIDGQDVFLAKYNSSGQIQWLKQLGGSLTQTAASFTLSNDKNYIYLALLNNGSCNFDGVNVITSGNFDIYIAKYNLNGNLIWVKEAAYGAENQTNGRLIVDEQGNLILAGGYLGDVTFYGETLPLISADPLVAQNFIAKFDSSGIPLWSKSINCNNSFTTIRSISCSNNSYYFSGQYIGNLTMDIGSINSNSAFRDGFIFKTNVNGTGQWIRKLTSIDNDLYVYKHVTDQSGNQYLTGYYSGNRIKIDSTSTDTSKVNRFNVLNGFSDLFIAKYNSSGILQWAKSIGTSRNERTTSVSFANNKIAITGSYEGKIGFGNFNLLNYGGSDIFISESDDAGNFINSQRAYGKSTDIGQVIAYSSTGRNFVTIGDFISDTLYVGSNQFVNSLTGKRDGYITRFGCFDSTHFTVTPVTCIDGMGIPLVNDGAVTATPSDGNAPYTYLWSNGANTPTISNLGLGNFTCTVTGTNGCTLVSTATVGYKPLLQASITNIVNVNCSGSSTGSATVTASLGSPPYIYHWNTGATTSTITNKSAGTYSVTVTDQCGNEVYNTAIITQPALLTATTSQINVSCNGGSNGSATVVASGGISPYTYLWTGGGTLATKSGLIVGTYSCTITDANLCSISKTFIITQPTVLTATTSQVNVTCNNGSNGSATVTASGGTGPYNYLWNDPAPAQTTAACTALTVGIWSVTVTDANTCSIIKSVTITQPSVVIASISSQTNVGCFGGSNGTATATATGGSGTRTYVWNDPAPVQTTATCTGLSAGVWNVTVTRTGGCGVTSVTITQPVALTSSIASTNVRCKNQSNGTATVTASGGTPTYSYNWAPNGHTGDGTVTYSNLNAGNYRVTTTDLNSCTSVSYVTITEPATLTVGTTKTCSNASPNCTGTITANPTGGTLPYSYLWSATTGSQTTKTAINVCVGSNYRVTVTDVNGCTRRSTRVTISLCVFKSAEIEDNGLIDNANSISIYPNPTTDKLNILVDNQGSDKEGAIIEIEIYNLLGKLILKERKEIIYGVAIIKDVSTFSTGLYLVKIIDGDEQITERILIQK